MRVSWNYILALVGGFILSIAFFVGCLYTLAGVPTESTHYDYDITQRKQLLAAERPGHRLLVVGGSSALFGINAQLIEKETGHPTVNMGTLLGLNLDYRFYLIKKIARPGDTILLACEYELYSDKPDYLTQDDYILARDPDYFYRMPFLDKLAMATRLPFSHLQKVWKIRRQPEQVAAPSAPFSPYTPFSDQVQPVDAYGDEQYSDESVRPTYEKAKINLDHLVGLLVTGVSPKTHGFDSLARFIQWAQANQITVLATFPNVVRQPVYEGSAARQAIATINQFYASHGVPVIGTAQEAMLPLGDFFDFMYHPTHQAALARTERLIPELRPYLSAH